MSSLVVPPVPTWRGCVGLVCGDCSSGQGRVPAASSGDQGWMQALKQLPGKVPCVSSWAGAAQEPWAFLLGRQHHSSWGWAGPPVSLTEPCSLVAGWELLDLVAAGKRLLGGICCERLGAVPWGPRAQGQVVEEVSEGEPRVPASSDPSYLPQPNAPWPPSEALDPVTDPADWGLLGGARWNSVLHVAPLVHKTPCWAPMWAWARPEPSFCCAPSAQPQSQGHHAVQPHGGLGLQTDRTPRYRTIHSGWLPTPGTDAPV